MFRHALLAAAVAASLGLVAAPATAAQVAVSINVGPPALRDEAQPEPRRGSQWAPGYWNWNGNRQRHNWVAGSWVRNRQG